MPRPLTRSMVDHVGTEETPRGNTTSVATDIARANPSSRGKDSPTLPLNTMYAAQKAPADMAKAKPSQLNEASGTLNASEIKTTPTPAARIAARSRNRRESTAAKTSGKAVLVVTLWKTGV